MNLFLLFVVILCFVSHACGCVTFDKITLQINDFAQSPQFVGFLAAQKLSFFQEQCLEVSIAFRESGSVIPAVLSNAAQFGIHFVPSILANDNGTNLLIVSQIFQRSAFRIVWPSANSQGGRCNLEGKSIGKVNALEMALQSQLYACTGASSLDSFLIVQNPEIRSPMAWLADAVSALTYKEYSKLLTSKSAQKKQIVSESDFSVFGDPYNSLLEDALFTSREWLQNTPNSADITKRFLIAALKGWIRCRDFEEDCLPLVNTDTPALGQYQLREVNRLIWPSPQGVGVMNVTSFDRTVAFLQEKVNFARNYTFPLPYDDSYVNLALRNLGAFAFDFGGVNYNKSSLSFCPEGESGYVICSEDVTPNSRGVPLRTIIVIIIPVSIVIAIASAAGLFLLWRRKALVKSFSQGDGNNTGYQIDFDELTVEAKIGSGSFGDVYKGTWRDTPVAVKRLRSAAIEDQLDELNREAVTMLQLRHPHIVLFMGCCSKVPNVCIVTEFMPKGSLFDVLHDERVDLPWERRLSMAKDTAKGLAFLHGSDPPTLHNDLKSSNLLVSHNWLCKVSDFGLTALKGSRTQDELLGSLYWMAPEVLNNDPTTEKSDVYSFGIILWELAARAEPYEGMSWAAVRVGVLKRKQRPMMPKNLDQDYVELIRECWDQEPVRRPTFPRIVKRLEEMSARRSKDTKSAPPPIGDKITIVFSDIQNSAFLWENCPTEMKEAMMIHNDIIRNAFREYRGYEVRSDGDSFMLAFPSAKDACAFSVRVTETLLMTKWNPELLSWLESEGRGSSEAGYEEIVFKGVRVRMGMHFGPCEFNRDPVTDRVEYTGPTPAKAARLSIAAQGGQVLVSSKFHDEIISDLHSVYSPPPYLMPIGTIYLKGFPEPEMCYQVLSPSLIGRHKKYMAQSSNQSTVIWQDHTNNLDSMFASHALPSAVRPQRNITLSAYPQDLSPSPNCPPSRGGNPPRTPSPTSSNPTASASSSNSNNAIPFPLSRPLPVSRAPNPPSLAPHHHHNHPPVPNAASTPSSSPPVSNSSSGPAPAPATLIPMLPVSSRGKTPRNIEQNTFTIDFNEISLGNEIGHGSYGVVMKGKWRGQQVAVKKLLRGKVKQEILTEFYNEVQIMCNLRCPNLILFMGACFKPPNLCIITELMPRNLFQVLHDSRITLTGRMRLRWARDIALGMNYLHKLNIIHRDLKSNNLLVDNSWNVKITDFGFARVKSTNQTMTKCGTVNWIAPEIAEGKTYTEKSDVYSYAITLYEILTRKVPFGNENANEVLEKVLEGKRPEIPAPYNSKFVNLIITCWHQDYDKRPSFEEILNMLESWEDSDCE